MLRGEARFELAVIIGDGPHARELRTALSASKFCAAVDGPGRLAEADLVMVDTDVTATAGALRHVISAVSPAALVTDLAPVKSGLLAEIEEEIPSGYGYVTSSVFPGGDGGIPGATVALMPVMGSVPEAIERMRLVWEQLGASKVLQLDQGTHDLWIAAQQLRTQVDRIAAKTAGADPGLNAPKAALSPEAFALNAEYTAWLVRRLAVES